MPDSSTIGLVAGSSVLAAALTQGSSLARDWLKRRRDAAFSALYAALTLEAYARSCSTYVSDSETYDASNQMAGAPHGCLPDKPVFPAQIDWDALGVDVTTECLSLLVEIDMADQRIAAEFEFVDGDAGVAEMRRAATDMGLRAFALAKSLRTAYRVKALKLDGEWNFLVYLNQQKQQYAELAQKYAESAASLFENMSMDHSDSDGSESDSGQ